MSYLTDKFLVTWADTISPRPCTPHASLDRAVQAAISMVANKDFLQSGAIVWVPLKLVTPNPVVAPVIVRDIVDGKVAEPSATFHND